MGGGVRGTPTCADTFSHLIGVAGPERQDVDVDKRGRAQCDSGYCAYLSWVKTKTSPPGKVRKNEKKRGKQQGGDRGSRLSESPASRSGKSKGAGRLCGTCQAGTSAFPLVKLSSCSQRSRTRVEFMQARNSLRVVRTSAPSLLTGSHVSPARLTASCSLTAPSPFRSLRVCVLVCRAHRMESSLLFSVRFFFAAAVL